MANRSARRLHIPPLLLLVALTLLLLGVALAAAPTPLASAAAAPIANQTVIQHMVEAELDAGVAPRLDGWGIAVRPAALPGRIVAELTGDQQNMLQQQGIAFTVTRRFVEARGGSDDPAGLSAGSVGGTNTADLPIPDSGASVVSAIEISGIPAGDLILGVDLNVIIKHNKLDDIIVEIHDPGGSYYTLLNRDPGKSYVTEIWKSYMPHWRGRQGNGTWRLWARDALVNSLDGMVDLWSLRVYYGSANTPTPTPTCNLGFTCLPTVRINAGGPSVVDAAGRAWSADRAYAACTAPFFGSTGGDVYSNPKPIDGTTDDVLYQSQRYFPGPGGYTLDVPNGVFSVTLRFAEIYPSAQVGERVFDVEAEGQRVIEALDVLARAGARYRALDISFAATVTDGKLDLRFIGRSGGAQPFISALSIEHIGCGAPTPTPTATATPTVPAGQAALLLSPDAGTYALGQIFQVDIVVDAGAQQVDGAQAFLSFDPNALVVVDAAGAPSNSIIAGSSFASHLANSVDNAAGLISYSDGVAPGSAPLTGRFTLATIRFKGKLPSGGAEVTFTRTWPRESKLTLAGANVLGTARGGRYQVAGSMLQGTMRLAGRPLPPAASQAVPLRVRLYTAGTATLVQETTVTSDAGGSFSVPVPPGTYDIVVKHSQSLSARVRNVTFGGGAVAVSFGVLLTGDANNDDAINMADFSTLRTTFLRVCEQAGFDGSADFNADCIVDISDFSLLQAGFLRSGPIDVAVP